ncbi:hypothetical protein CDL12_22272 [Handroanthus impetiginosus]|uniref:F-box domain-containing protein n=1 Tax=Handroanthus impetiginosus TaxID=429701 RepID=A0A2G9GJ22_9LAMI|nr:hypothetical protein CDL12_22272 [Handroanthus impetiginosus]
MKRVNQGFGMGLVRSTSFGRKRVACIDFDDDDDYNLRTLSKKQCFENSFSEKSILEDLPQEILIRILCGVDHDDLKNLFFVSKSVREVTLIAKKSHFAYSTPRKATTMFKNVEDFGDFNDVEAPNAPKQSRVPRFRLSRKKLADISVALFASDN